MQFAMDSNMNNVLCVVLKMWITHTHHEAYKWSLFTRINTFFKWSLPELLMRRGCASYTLAQLFTEIFMCWCNWIPGPIVTRPALGAVNEYLGRENTASKAVSKARPFFIQNGHHTNGLHETACDIHYKEIVQTSRIEAMSCMWCHLVQGDRALWNILYRTHVTHL